MGKTCTKSSRRYDRTRELGEQETGDCFKSFARKVQEIEKTNVNITADFITSSLNCSPNFIGCYAEDQVENLKITSFPCFLIVNIDSSELPGSHWIGLGVFQNKIEIFDPLGFNIFNWSRIPCGLLNFLHTLSVSKTVVVNPRIQSDESNLCGLFSIFYVLKRAKQSFVEVFAPFDLKNFEMNDCILFDLLK